MPTPVSLLKSTAAQNTLASDGAGRLVNCDPSTAGIFAFESNCNKLFAEVPTANSSFSGSICILSAATALPINVVP